MASAGSPPGPRRERAMTSLKSVATKERRAHAGDACLVTAAAFGLVTGALALIFMPEGEPPEARVSDTNRSSFSYAETRSSHRGPRNFSSRGRCPTSG